MHPDTVALIVITCVVLLMGSCFVSVENYHSEECKKKGGVYVTRINRCVRKDMFVGE